MVFDLSSVIVLMIIGAVVAFWWKAKEAQERALRAARSYCENMGLQLLDQCVAESSWRLSRDENGRVCLLREYQFEFTSTGYERYTGEVIMRGQRLQQVMVTPHRIN